MDATPSFVLTKIPEVPSNPQLTLTKTIFQKLYYMNEQLSKSLPRYKKFLSELNATSKVIPRISGRRHRGIFL